MKAAARYKMFIFLLLFLYGLTAEFACAVGLTLDEAITIALRQNRQILLTKEELEKVKLELGKARSLMLPQINVSGSLTRQDGLTQDTTQFASQVGVRQYLYRAGMAMSSIRYAQGSLEFVQAVLDEASRELIFNVKKAAYTYVLLIRLAKLQKQILHNQYKHLETINLRYQKGEASWSDLLAVKSRWQQAQKAYHNSLNQLEETREILRNLLALAKDVPIHIEAVLEYSPKDIAYQQAYLQAMKSHPLIRQMEAQISLKKSSLGITKAQAGPNLFVSWDYYQRSHINTAIGATKDWNDYQTVALGISWPFFDGGLTQAKTKQAIIELRQAQLAKEKTQADLASELKQAYLNLDNAINTLKSVRAEMDKYRDNFYVQEGRYKKGIISALEFEDSRLAYNLAVFQEKQAIYDYILAALKFAQVSGGQL